jgi:hypothetical protein
MTRLKHQTTVEIEVSDADSDVLAAFWRWVQDQRLQPVFTVFTGGGGLRAFWTPGDAARVLAWFGDQMMTELAERQ